MPRPRRHSDSDLSPRGSQDPDRLPHTLPAREAAIVAGKERLAHRLRSLELEEVVPGVRKER